MTKTLTILLSVYNSCINEDLFRNTLESLCNQTSKDYSLLIIDDCSTDKTPIILAEYKEKFNDIIQIIRNATNKGMVDSYNYGASLIETPYMCYITDNNVFYPTFVEEMTKFALSSDLDFAESYWMKGQHIRNPYEDDDRALTHIMKTSVWQEIGGIGKNIGWCTDSDIWYKIKYHQPPYRIAVLHRILGRYYAVPNDQTNLLSPVKRREELWRFHQAWKIRESRYIEGRDKPFDDWYKELQEIYPSYQVLKAPDNISLENLFATLEVLKDKSILVFLLNVDKDIELGNYFRFLNIREEIKYFPDTNPPYVSRFRSPAIEENGVKYFRFCLVKE